PSKLWPWRFLSSLWRLRRLVRRHAIELIHCNEQDIYPIGKYLGRLCSLPVVVSIHCKMGPAYFRWAFGGRQRPERIFFVSRGNQRANSEGMADLVPESDWRLLPNGLDVEHFRPTPNRRAAFRRDHGLGAGPVIGVACALRPGKQIEHLFEAAARL